MLPGSGHAQWKYDSSMSHGSMSDQEFATSSKQVRQSIGAFGRVAYARRTSLSVRSWACLETGVPKEAGVYWVETNMPVARLQEGIHQVTGKERRVRKSAPKGTILLHQECNELYVAYSGTEGDLQTRLGQHLFNRGNAGTVKLGCIVDQEPFTKHDWRVSFTVIEDYVVRYAVEAWWRLEVGWPVFCIR